MVKTTTTKTGDLSLLKQIEVMMGKEQKKKALALRQWRVHQNLGINQLDIKQKEPQEEWGKSIGKHPIPKYNQ